MTRQRSQSITINKAEPLCEPDQSRGCVVRSRCARYLAAQLPGQAIKDYTNDGTGGSYLCVGYMRVGGPPLATMGRKC